MAVQIKLIVVVVICSVIIRRLTIVAAEFVVNMRLTQLCCWCRNIVCFHAYFSFDVRVRETSTELSFVRMLWPC